MSARGLTLSLLELSRERVVNVSVCGGRLIGMSVECRRVGNGEGQVVLQAVGQVGLRKAFVSLGIITASNGMEAHIGDE